MKKFIKLVIRSVVLLMASVLSAQTSNQWVDTEKKIQAMDSRNTVSIEAVSNYINKHFTNDAERLMAIYYWLGTNIDYDMASLNRPPKDESRIEIIHSTFRNRKGVCEGYAGLMDTLGKLAGIQVHTIYGFTRQQERIDDMPHAWNAAFVDDQWFLFDPTFASGSLVGRRYMRAFDEAWFMVKPEQMIHTHMPYDPIWQFLDEPVTYRSFAAGKPKSGLYAQPIAFADSITMQMQLPKKAQYSNELRRIGLNNFTHNTVSYRTDYLSEAIRVHEANRKIALFNEATQAFNRAADLYNSYAVQRNQSRLTDSQAAHLAELLVKAMDEVTLVKSKLSMIEKPASDLMRSIRSLKTQLDSLEKRLLNELKTIGHNP